MSFPQTDEVIANFDDSTVAVGDLLRQYRTLCETQEQTIEQFRADAAEVETLRQTVKELQAKIDAMEAHPDVRAKRLADAQRRMAEAEAELAALEGQG